MAKNSSAYEGSQLACEMRSYIRIILLLAAFVLHAGDARVYFANKFQQVAAKSTPVWRQVVIQSDGARGTDYEPYDSTTFRRADQIEDLFIVNKINALRPDVFRAMRHLRTLHLDENNLPNVMKDDFGGLTLAQLIITNNNIASIQPGAFALSAIERIDASRNAIQEISGDVFTNSTCLRRLSLAGNKLTRINERALSRNLTHLDLSQNMLHDISITVFEGLYELTYLNLSHNKLPTVTSALWLRNLEVLDLTYNSIRILVNGAFEDYPKLRTLYLSHNELLYLNPLSFTRSTSIEDLRLDHNMLTFLPGEVGSVFSNLRRFKFGGNPWSCACLATIEGFRKRSGIELDECEKHYFTDGQHAVCLTAYGTCYGNETLLLLGHPGIYQTLIDGYPC